MKKQAILIIAHNNLDIIIKNIKILNSQNIDFFIHLDKKSSIDVDSIINNSELNNISSKIFVYKQISVAWGGFSLVEVELMLLKETLKYSNDCKFKYDHIHLISGVDMPLMNSNDFIEFFSKNPMTEYVHFYSQTLPKDIYDRFNYYHIFEENSWKRKKVGKIIYKILNGISKLIQKILFINRIDKNIKYQYGSQWFSITSNFAEYIVSNENTVRRLFSKSVACDEIFIQTLLINSKYVENLYISEFNDNYKACMRFIDWKKGNPYTFKKNDYEELINSNCAFARKFDLNTDKEIIELIYKNYSK